MPEAFRQGGRGQDSFQSNSLERDSDDIVQSE